MKNLSPGNPFYDLSKSKLSEDNPFSNLINNDSETSQKELNPNLIHRIPSALGEVGNDIKDIVKGLPSTILQGLSNVPNRYNQLKEELPGVVNQVSHDPMRVLRNIGSGLAEIGNSELNAPSSLANYLSHIGMISPETASKVWKQGDISKDINEFVGNDKQSGDALIRGLTSNLETLLPAGKAITSIAGYPLKYSEKNIVKNIINTESSMKSKYSNLYSNLFDEARNRGIKKVNVDPNIIKKNINIIKPGTPSKYYKSLENFAYDANHENAQKVISDLGKLERELNNRTVLTSSEKKILNAANETKENIQMNMFKDSNGNIHNDLLNNHNIIQKGYANEVVPYTTNKALRNYKRQELSKKELINSLSKGKFAAKRGSSHPELAQRKIIKEILGSKIALGSYIGAGFTGGSYLLKKLLSQDNE